MRTKVKRYKKLEEKIYVGLNLEKDLTPPRHSMASQITAEHKKKAIEEIQRKLGHFTKGPQKRYVVNN